MKKNTPLLMTGSAWERLVSNMHFEPTVEGFTRAWIQNCGHRPSPQQIDDFRRSIQKALGELPRPKPQKPVSQPMLFDTEGE